MDHVCRKLRLQPGETVVEAGCGWGALALHMAREYGVSVKAYNVSHEQIAFARERARAEMDLASAWSTSKTTGALSPGKFDVFVSVGMLEHVGLDHFQEFSRYHSPQHRRHGSRPAALHRAKLSRCIQPLDSQAHFSRRICSFACGSHCGFWSRRNYAVLDVENLRMHYAKTLEHWLERFEQVEAAGDRDVRFAVRAGLAAVPGGIDRRVSRRPFAVVPDLFSGSKREPISWTRDPLYADESAGRCAGNREGQMDACDVLIVGGGPAGSSCAWGLCGIPGLTLRFSTGRRSRAIKSAADGSPRRSERTGDRSRGIRTRARPAANHRLSHRLDRRTGAGNRYSKTVSYGIRRREFDDYLIASLGRAPDARDCPHVACSAENGGWMANGNISATPGGGSGRPLLSGGQACRRKKPARERGGGPRGRIRDGRQQQAACRVRAIRRNFTSARI